MESGVDVLPTSLNGPLCGRVQNWDDHAVNHNVFEAMKFRSQVYDQAVWHPVGSDGGRQGQFIEQ